MRKLKGLVTIAAAVLIVFVPSVSQAWNYAGHRAIASIAYRQLDEPTRKRVAEALKNHPAYADLWAKRPTNGTDEALNLFWNASVFPDDARRAPWDKYNRPLSHYINYRLQAERENKVDQPLDGENVVNSYVAHVLKVGDKATTAEDRAVHLSWIFHQAGDIHQPLHAVARFSKALPDGDRGGNAVTFPNPHARDERGNNLHAYWDDVLGADIAPEAIEKLAEGLIAEYPRAEFAGELTTTIIDLWAKESLQVALKTVYNNLDPNVTKFVDRPVGYDADARNAARRRAALAGYRLAEQLKASFPEK